MFAKPTYIIIIYCTATRMGKVGKAGPYVVGALLYEASCRSDVLAINCNGKRVAAEGRHWAKGVWGGSNYIEKPELFDDRAGSDAFQSLL